MGLVKNIKRFSNLMFEATLNGDLRWYRRTGIYGDSLGVLKTCFKIQFEVEQVHSISGIVTKRIPIVTYQYYSGYLEEKDGVISFYEPAYTKRYLRVDSTMNPELLTTYLIADEIARTDSTEVIRCQVFNLNKDGTYEYLGFKEDI